MATWNCREHTMMWFASILFIFSTKLAMSMLSIEHSRPLESSVQYSIPCIYAIQAFSWRARYAYDQTEELEEVDVVKGSHDLARFEHRPFGHENGSHLLILIIVTMDPIPGPLHII